MYDAIKALHEITSNHHVLNRSGARKDLQELQLQISTQLMC